MWLVWFAQTSCFPLHCSSLPSCWSEPSSDQSQTSILLSCCQIEFWSTKTVYREPDFHPDSQSKNSLTPCTWLPGTWADYLSTHNKFSFFQYQYRGSFLKQCDFHFVKIGEKIASSGNRTRAARVAGEHSTTEPTMHSVWRDSHVYTKDKQVKLKYSKSIRSR